MSQPEVPGSFPLSLSDDEGREQQSSGPRVAQRDSRVGRCPEVYYRVATDSLLLVRQIHRPERWIHRHLTRSKSSLPILQFSFRRLPSTKVSVQRSHVPFVTMLIFRYSHRMAESKNARGAKKHCQFSQKVQGESCADSDNHPRSDSPDDPCSHSSQRWSLLAGKERCLWTLGNESQFRRADGDTSQTRPSL